MTRTEQTALYALERVREELRDVTLRLDHLLARRHALTADRLDDLANDMQRLTTRCQLLALALGDRD